MRRILAALLLALLALPLAGAHIAHERASLQRFQVERLVEARVEGRIVIVDEVLANDPLRQLVRHTADGTRGAFTVEHRKEASSTADRVVVGWTLTRMVEYRDANSNLLFDPADAVVRSWRLESYRWNVSEIRDVTLAGEKAKSIVWTGNQTGGPGLTLELAAVGKEVTDEGARIRPQDVALYIDVHGIPPRQVGNLHAIEGELRYGVAGAVTRDEATNTTVALRVDEAGRRAFLVWGGEALLDGKEQRLRATLGDPATKGENVTQPFRLHFPAFEHDARLVVVSGIEYALPTQRPTPTWAGLVVVALVLAAFARRVSPSR